VPLWSREKDYNAIIDGMALGYGVPATIIKGVIAKESNFKPDAYRYESRVKDRTVNGKPAPGPDASRGLMQVLEFRAREQGFSGPADDLFKPSVNIQHGTILLKKNLERAQGRIDVALSAYNAGWSEQRPNDAKRDERGEIINRDYVERVKVYAGYFAGKLTAGDVLKIEAGQMATPALVFFWPVSLPGLSSDKGGARD